MIAKYRSFLRKTKQFGTQKPISNSSFNEKSCCPQQVVFHKPVDYSKAVVYKCKLADYSKVVVYKCKPVDYSKVAVYKCKLVVYKCKLADYSKVAVYTSVNWWFTSCKLAVYTCKVLNSRFTTVLLVTLLDTVEVTPFFQFFFL